MVFSKVDDKGGEHGLCEGGKQGIFKGGKCG